MTSTESATIFFDKNERNGAQMKSQTNDTKNRQVVSDKCARQTVLHEAISCKIEISWLHEYQTLK